MISFVAGLIVGILCAFNAGWYARRAYLMLTHLMSKQSKPNTPAVTRTNRAFVNENRPLSQDSAIVIPKTPQLLEFEEQEELRKMNLKPQ